MINDVSIIDALEYKDKLSNIDGVTSVSWLDDMVGLDTLKSMPIEFIDETIVENYYKENSALLTLSVENGKEQSTVAKIYDLIGENNAASGQAVSLAEVQNMSVSEVSNAMMILLPIVILILILTTSSWIGTITLYCVHWYSNCC